jgi:hypothetical protein
MASCAAAVHNLELIPAANSTGNTSTSRGNPRTSRCAPQIACSSLSSKPQSDSPAGGAATTAQRSPGPIRAAGQDSPSSVRSRER